MILPGLVRPSKPALRLQAEQQFAAGAGLKEAAIAIVDDHRARMLAVGQVVQANKLTKCPITPILLELNDQIQQGVSAR